MNTTIGIYHPGNSFWHSLDPRSKAIAVLGVMVALFSSQGMGLGLIYLLIIVLYRTSGLPRRLEWEVVVKFKWLLIISFLANIVFPINNETWYSLVVNHLSIALSITIRLSAVLLVASWLSYITKPMVLVEGLTYFFKPFSRFYLGRLDLPLMIGLVVRFVPELLFESEKIMIAQRIRGIKPGFNLKNGVGWVKSTIIPIFLAGIRRATALAIAMEARGYRPGAPRSPIRILKFNYKDYFTIGFSVALIIWYLIDRIW